MKKRIISVLLAMLLAFTAVLPGNFSVKAYAEEAESQSGNDLTETQRNSINMLNYLTVVITELESSSNNRLLLDSIYDELYNDVEPSIVDEKTYEEYMGILKTIKQFQQFNAKNERLQTLYNQCVASGILSEISDPLAIVDDIASKNYLAAILDTANIAYEVISGYTSSNDESLEEGCTLSDEESALLDDCNAGMFEYMVQVAADLPRGITLSQSNVEDFVKWENEENVVSRIRWLESNQSTYENFGEYWLVLADSYYANKDYDKCLAAIETYQGLDNSIFRKDRRLAQSLQNAIISADETMGGTAYINTAYKYAKMILNNTDSDEWALRYFAAQTFLNLYSETKNRDYLQQAYDIAYDNVNELKAQQVSLNNTYLADIQTESTKGVDKESKVEIEDYNKYLKETRETELVPIYEPLLLNCELLFALADELQITDVQKRDIDSILHPNGDMLFLNSALDNIYRFYSASKAVNTAELDVSFDKTEITLPASILTNLSTVSVVITMENGTTQEITNLTLKEVNRHKSNDLSDFTATYTSNDAKDIKVSSIYSIEINVNPIGKVNENEPEPYSFKFFSNDNKVLFFSSTSFIRQ